MKFLAACLVETNRSLELLEVYPRRLSRGQVLVKIHDSGICGSQLAEIKGQRGVDRWLPHLLGHEAFGEVIDCGPDVRKVSVGDKVICTWMVGHGIEADGARYDSEIGVINAGKVTTFSEYSVISENRLVKSPADVASSVASLFGCALPTGSGVVFNELPHTLDDSNVLLVGMGGVGFASYLALSIKKPKKLVVVDPNFKAIIAAAGCPSCATNTVFLDPSDKDFKDNFFLEIPFGADYSVEAAGRVDTIEMAFSLLSKNGKCVFVSHPPSGQKISLDPHELITGKSISGSWGGGCAIDRDIPLFAEYFSSLDLEILYARSVYNLTDINHAVDDMAAGKVRRPRILMNDE